MASAAAPNSGRASSPTPETIAAELYARHRGRLIAIARRNSTTFEDAEEALQDALILFIDHYDPASGAPPLAWLTLTLKRRCWALVRNRRVASHPDASEEALALLPDPGHSPDHLAEVEDVVSRVRAQLTALKHDERDALSLSVLGYSYREIAELRGWTYTKVNRCIREGRAAMRRAREKEPP